MSDQEIIKAVAELDGWEYYEDPKDNKHCYSKSHRWFSTKYRVCSPSCCDHYLASYDAIIPVIQKQPLTIRLAMFKDAKVSIATTPRQMCEALLRATGKWKEEGV